MTTLNSIGATPFLLAARTADAPLMKLLAELGADPLLTNDDGSTPLMVAAGLGTNAPGEDPGTEPEVLDAVKVALDLGNDLNAVDKNGETAMHGAAYKHVPSVVRYLAEKGARMDVEPSEQQGVDAAQDHRRRPARHEHRQLAADCGGHSRSDGLEVASIPNSGVDVGQTSGQLQIERQRLAFAHRKLACVPAKLFLKLGCELPPLFEVLDGCCDVASGPHPARFESSVRVRSRGPDPSARDHRLLLGLCRQDHHDVIAQRLSSCVRHLAGDLGQAIGHSDRDDVPSNTTRPLMSAPFPVTMRTPLMSLPDTTMGTDANSPPVAPGRGMGRMSIECSPGAMPVIVNEPSEPPSPHQK